MRKNKFMTMKSFFKKGAKNIILIILLVLPFLDMVPNGSTQECLYLIKNVEKDIWVLEGKKLVMWGHRDILAPPHIPHNNQS